MTKINIKLVGINSGVMLTKIDEDNCADLIDQIIGNEGIRRIEITWGDITTPKSSPTLKPELDNSDDGTSGNSEGEDKDNHSGNSSQHKEPDNTLEEPEEPEPPDVPDSNTIPDTTKLELDNDGEDVSTHQGETSQQEEPINIPVDLITSADLDTPEEPKEPETPDPLIFREQDRISKTKLAKYIDIDIFDMGYHNQIQGKIVICYGTTKVYTSWEDMLKLPVLVNNKSLKDINNLKQVAVKQFRKWMADHPDLLPDEANPDSDFRPHLKGVINTKPGDGGDYENTSGSYSDGD